MSFKTVRRTIGMKTEGTAYTAETLVLGDYNFKARNIQYNVDFEEYKRKYATGDMAAFASVMAGKQSFTCSFSMDLAIGTTAGSVPAYGKVLKAAGFDESDGGSDIYYKLLTGAGVILDKPVTIEIVELDDASSSPSQLVIKAKGCMAKSCKIVCDGVGQPAQLQFEFHGSLVSITDRAYGAILTPTAYDSKVPPSLLSATLTFDGVALPLDKFSIDIGLNGQLEVDASAASGYKGAHIVDMNPMFTADPKMQLLAVDGHYTKLLAGTVGILSISFGSTILLYAPKMQLTKAYNPGDRAGLVTSNIEGILTRDAAEDGSAAATAPFYIKLT